MDTTTRNMLHLVDMGSLERVSIQYVPRNIKMRKSADLARLKVIGRNEPVIHITGGRKELSLDLDFHCVQEDRQDVIRKVRWLESLASSDGFENPQPLVKLIWGDLYRHNLWKVEFVDATFELFDADYQMLPKQAYVKIVLIPITPKNRTHDDIKRY